MFICEIPYRHINISTINHGFNGNSMLFNKINIQSILLLAIAVLLILQFTCKSKPLPPDNSALIKAKDEVIQSVIRERETFRQWKDETVMELQRKDSLLQIKQATNIIKYEKIPVIINGYDNDELRRAIEGFN